LPLVGRFFYPYIQAVVSSETLVLIYQTARHHVQEDFNLKYNLLLLSLFFRVLFSARVNDDTEREKTGTEK
jgi:hypothetical protein